MFAGSNIEKALVFLWFLFGAAIGCRSQTVLNVKDFGARGDVVRILVNTVSNSTEVSVEGTNRFSMADVGKVIEVFRAGPWVRYGTSVVVTQQDVVCLITNVAGGTNLSLSIPCGWTTNAYCVVGTNNAEAFQSAINSASNLVARGEATNVTIDIPAGRYLLCSPEVLEPNYVMTSISDTHPALTVSSGGIRFLGTGNSSTNTVLMGCGAGMNHYVSSMYPSGEAPYVPMRDTLIFCRGPVQNSQYPLVFENLTFDGGLTNGAQSYKYWMIRQGDGSGWDMTHHAVADFGAFGKGLGYELNGQAQMNQLKVLTNCVFKHWRGEVLICWTGDVTNAFNDIADCVFEDGNATADNMYYGQHVHGCTFSGMGKVMEYYQGNASLPSVFENNLWTNIAGNALTIVGATTNANPPDFIIRSNRFYGTANCDQIMFSPAENVSISNNVFYGSASTGIALTGAGLQPSDGSATIISNIVVSGNAFNDTHIALYMDGYSAVDVLATNNTSASSGAFALTAGGFKKNIVLAGNMAPNIFINSASVEAGEYFVDKPSNQFEWYGYNDRTGVTNLISYGHGRRHLISYAVASSVFEIATNSLVPPGATLEISNACSLSVSVSGLSIPKGGVLDLAWMNHKWRRTTDRSPRQ